MLGQWQAKAVKANTNTTKTELSFSISLQLPLILYSSSPFLFPVWIGAPSPCWKADTSSYNFTAAGKPWEDDSGCCCQSLGEGWKVMEVTRLGRWCHSAVQKLQACGLKQGVSRPCSSFLLLSPQVLIVYHVLEKCLSWSTAPANERSPCTFVTFLFRSGHLSGNSQSLSLLCCSNTPETTYVKLSLCWAMEKKPQMVFDVNQGLKAERQNKSCVVINTHEEWNIFSFGKDSKQSSKVTFITFWLWPQQQVGRGHTSEET